MSTNSTDPKIKGVRSGLAQVHLDKCNSITGQLDAFFFPDDYWKRSNKIPDFGITGCSAALLKGAKLTDFLDYAPNLLTCQFLISERVAEVFSKFNIGQHFLYPVEISGAGKIIKSKYYLFCCPLVGYECIDFSESIFYKQQGIFPESKKYVSYDNAESFLERYIVGIQAEKLVFNSNFDRTLDFFDLRIGEMYVSEALKDAIEILGFTGVSIFSDKGPKLIVGHT